MTSYDERLAAFEGRQLVSFKPGQDPVNVPMIRHWVEAMEDANPVYLSDEAARATGREGIVAPASMMQAWTMRGYAATVNPAQQDPAFTELIALLDEGGYTSVVATDSEFDFHREVRPGDHLGAEEVVESISPEKSTALGVGRFVTTVRTYRDQAGEVVATQRWRTLRFRPKATSEVSTLRPAQGTAGSTTEVSTGSTTDVSTTETGSTTEGALRPRPAVNPDNQFWFDGATEKRLLIQRCASCKTLRHPPGPCCPECRSFDWDTVEASGRATLYSYVVAHHPKHPAFEYPLLVAVVELEEGTRLITNLVDVERDEVRIGMPLELTWLEADPELTLPVFRPATIEEH